MKSRRSLLPIFFLFFFLALGIFAFSATDAGKSVNGFFEQVTLPIQKTVFSAFGQGQATAPDSQLRVENVKLQLLIAKQKDLEKENDALRDQFKTTTPSAKQLVPAQVIGGKSDEVILDKGSADGIKINSLLIIKDNVIGRIVKVSVYRSVGELLTKDNTSFTAKTAKTSALGIIQGKGETLVLSNVVLADKLEKNDIVVTKGDIDQNGGGFPPDLVVGKIVSVNKKDSELFQSAEVEPLVNFRRTETVFVMVN
jgi:rod shape-determining protein MreC